MPNVPKLTDKGSRNVTNPFISGALAEPFNPTHSRKQKWGETQKIRQNRGFGKSASRLPNGLLDWKSSLSFLAMEIIVPLGRKSSLIVRNAFESLAELEIARTKWTNRELCTSYMRQFIATVNADRTYYGVVINKNNLSVCAVNGAGSEN